MQIKHFYLLMSCILLTSSVFCQIPQGFKWQGVAKDSLGNPITLPVTLTFAILQNTDTVYVETHPPIIPNAGQITAIVGGGIALQDTFSNIDWSVGSYSLNVKMQIASGTIVDMGTSEILAVPHSLGISPQYRLYLRPLEDANYSQNLILQGGAASTSAIGEDYYGIYFNDGTNSDSTRRNLWAYGSVNRIMDMSVDGRLSIGSLIDGNSLKESLRISGKLSKKISLFSSAVDEDNQISSYDEFGDRIWMMNLSDRDLGNRFGLYSQYLGEYALSIATNGHIGIGDEPGNTRFYVKHFDSNAYAAVFKNSAGPGHGVKISAGALGEENSRLLYVGDYEDTGSPYLVVKGNGRVGIGTSVPQEKLQVEGTIQTKVLKITGGSDITEKVNSTELVQPGEVIIIDPTNPNKVMRSTKPYDRRVLGVVSGAGGISAGLELKQEGSLEGNTSFAISGRVYVKVSGKVKPGDQLTTSNIPGYAMKASNIFRRNGTIIGKALSFPNENGLVLMLVNVH